MLDSPRGKNEGTCRSGEGGGGPAMSDLCYYWEGAREWCGDDEWDEEKKMLQRKVYGYFYK